MLRPSPTLGSSFGMEYSEEEDMYLVEVDDGLPEVVLLLVEVPHTNLTEVTRMVLKCEGLVSNLFAASSSIPPVESFVLSEGGGSSNLVHVGSVVMLTTGKTTTTGVLAVLSYTTMTVRDVAATVKLVSMISKLLALTCSFSLPPCCPPKTIQKFPPLAQPQLTGNQQQQHRGRMMRIRRGERRTACGSSKCG